MCFSIEVNGVIRRAALQSLEGAAGNLIANSGVANSSFPIAHPSHLPSVSANPMGSTGGGVTSFANLNGQPAQAHVNARMSQVRTLSVAVRPVSDFYICVRLRTQSVPFMSTAPLHTTRTLQQLGHLVESRIDRILSKISRKRMLRILRRGETVAQHTFNSNGHLHLSL